MSWIAADRTRRAPSPMVVLRIGLGVVWTLNLMFILDPANGFFPGFAATALSFGPTSLGGPAMAEFVAAHALVFSAAVALTTAYLAVALLLGATTRLACLVGLVFNGLLLVSQYGTIVVIPGGTDVGPMPVYLVAYLALLAAGTPIGYSIDAWWADRSASPTTPSGARLAGDAGSSLQT